MDKVDLFLILSTFKSDIDLGPNLSRSYLIRHFDIRRALSFYM